MRVRLRGLRLKRGKWAVAIPLYDVRACPDCGGLVWGWPGQWQHAQWHADLEPGVEEVPEVDGYVVGQGMAPADVFSGEGE